MTENETAITRTDSAGFPAGTHRCVRTWCLRPALVVLVSLALTALVGALLAWPQQAASQELPSLRIDPNPAANEATYVDTVESCFAALTGEVFHVDVIIEGVEELLAWDIYIDYDASLLELVGRRVDLFQEANEGSDVFDVSDALPVETSPFRLAAADISDPPTPDSGSGVLGRLTFKARDSGTSTIGFSSIDIDEDGVIDRAPFLRNVAGDPIADTDGDTFFDGEATGAEIAIDEACQDTGPVGGDALDEGGSTGGAWIVAGIGAALAIVLGSAGVLAWRRRSGRADTDI